MEHIINSLAPVSEELTLNLISLLYARKYTYENNWHSNLHTHNHAELFYITEGKGSFQFSMKYCNVAQGDILLINADVPHTEISSNETPLGYIVLGVKGLEALGGSNENDEFVLLSSLEDRNAVLSLLEIILYEAESENDNNIAICENLLKSVILYLLRRTSFAAEPSRTGKRNSKECAAVRRYIDSHHKENLTLDDLADYAHISKYYMVRAFKQEYGISPISYLQYRRISESKKLLKETSMPASQIAQILGFSSASHFTQCFKRLVMTTPTEFRKISKDIIIKS